MGDLGCGKFDGTWLVSNFENLNPSNTLWTKHYNLYSKVDTEAPRYLEFEEWWSAARRPRLAWRRWKMLEASEMHETAKQAKREKARSEPRRGWGRTSRATSIPSAHSVNVKRGLNVMSGFLRPAELDEISSEIEAAKLDEEEQYKRKQEQTKRELREAFMARDVHPDVVERVNNAVRIAARQGHHQLEVMTFPCSYCNDGGRRINNQLPDWPTSLEGFAKRAYEFYDRN